MKRLLIGLLLVANSVFCKVEINPELFNQAVFMAISWKVKIEQELENAIKNSDTHENEQRLALLRALEQDALAHCYKQTAAPVFCDEVVAFVQRMIEISEKRRAELDRCPFRRTHCDCAKKATEIEFAEEQA